MLPKQRWQSTPPLSQKSVPVVSVPADVALPESIEDAELSEPIVSVGLAELAKGAELTAIVDDIGPLESDPDEDDVQTSIPCSLSPGL